MGCVQGEGTENSDIPQNTVTDAPNGTVNDGTEESNTEKTGDAALTADGTAEPTQEPVSEITYIELAPTHIYTNKVLFSEKDYFYTGPVTVEMSLDCVSGGSIHYTLDGSVPDITSDEYLEPITIAPATNGGIAIAMLRANALLEDGTWTETSTHNYFIGENVDSRYTTTVISITGDNKDFYDYTRGILSSRNRYFHGKSMERKVYVTAVSADGELMFEQDCGIRMIGGDSRAYPAPSLKLYARKEYSADRGYFPFELFGTPRQDKPDKVVNKYDKLVLRTNGDDSQSTMMRDVLVHRLAANLGFENYEAAVPAVVYINGEYYNLVWIRENYCDKYFKHKYGDADGEFVVVEECETAKHYQSGSSELEMKAVNEYNAMYKKYAYSNLTDEANYAALCTMLDVEDYLKYYALECYVANTDWPNNNEYAYRYYPSEGEELGEGVFDGRWRFLPHDFDYSSSIYNAPGGNPPSYNMYKVVTTSGNSRYSPLFTALMKRQDCRKFFVDYTYAMADGELAGQRVSEEIDKLLAMREGELPYFMEYLEVLKKRYQRGETEYAIYMTEASMQKSIANLKDFYDKRPEYAKKYVTELFGE